MLVSCAQVFYMELWDFTKQYRKFACCHQVFFFQHLNEKENQLNYVLAVLYKQCIVRRTYFHIFQFFKVFNVSVKNNFIKQILSS